MLDGLAPINYDYGSHTCFAAGSPTKHSIFTEFMPATGSVADTYLQQILGTLSSKLLYYIQTYRWYLAGLSYSKMKVVM